MTVRIITVTLLTILLSVVSFGQQDTGKAAPPSGASKTEVLPILSYDTDTGLGYGAKLFLLDLLHTRESFDLTVFNSTKGERWYRFVLSVPDFELRQGTEYPAAFDLVIDYDKWTAYSFFGVGNGSRFEDRTMYSREPLELTLTLSRGFSTVLVGQLGLRFKTISSDVAFFPPEGLSEGSVSYASVFGTLRLDSRDSYINPSRGIVLSGELETVPSAVFGTVSFSRAALWVQHYTPLPLPRTVLAVRVGAVGLAGEDLPAQVLLPIGGGTTLRGYVQDRYLDLLSMVSNLEVRFPIFWRFGGIAGIDAGKVWHRITEVNFARWPTDPVLGLRFFMDTFIVRLDVGFGRETTGLYLNFGHLF